MIHGYHVILPMYGFWLPNDPRGSWSDFVRAWEQVFLDSEEEVEEAIRYVEANPEKEGKRKQHWSFVTPFAGIPQGGWTTYH